MTPSFFLDAQIFRALPGNCLLLLPDERFTIVAATEGYLQATGCSLDALHGSSLPELVEKFAAEDRHHAKKVVRTALQQVLSNTTPHRLMLGYNSANGQQPASCWQLSQKPILDGGGNLAYILHTAEDTASETGVGRREETLNELEKSYQELMEAPILLCLLKGPEHRIAMASEQTLRLWGQNRTILGEPILQVLPETKSQGFPELLQKLQRTKKPAHVYAFPVSAVKEGKPQTLYLDIILQPYFEQPADDVPAGIVCIAHDQTEQVIARKKAAESEQRFQDLIAEADVATAIYFSRAMRIQYANDAMIRLWGKDKSVIGKTVREALPELEDQPFHALLDRVFTTGETYWGKEDKAELVVDGRLQTFYFNFTYKALRTPAGEVYGILNMATDITEQVLARKQLQESEANLRNTILQAPVAMCILRGPHFVVEVANEHIYEIWGKQQSDMLGKPVFEGLPEAKNQGLEELLDNVYKKGEGFVANERPVNLPRNGGLETVYLNFVYEPFRGGDGTVSGIIVVASDITSQVESRKKVEASAQQVRSLVESAPFPIGVYTGREMRITLANQSIIDVWGKGSNVIGKRYAELLPELAGSGIYDQLDSVYTTGQPFHARNQRVNLMVNGQLQPHYFNYSFTPLFDTNGAVYGVMNTAAEITDLMMARKKVEQSEQRFQNLIREATVGIVVLIGSNLNVAVVNEAYARLIGRQADELLHRNLFSVIPETEPQFRPLIETVRQSGEAVNLYDQAYTVFAGGKEITGFLNIVYQPYRETDGSISGVMVVCQDVTSQVLARKKIAEAQETARIAVEAAGMGTYDVDLQSGNMIRSERTDAIFDVEHNSHRDALIKALHPDDLAIRKAAYEEAFQTGHLEYEARVLRKNGAIRWIRIKGSIFYEGEKPLKLVGVVQDVTAEKEFARALATKVKERTRELEQFLFVSHHDLQEPLRKIALFSDMIKTETYHLLPEASQKRFDKIIDAARRMSAALRDVLDFASLNKDQLFEPTDLAAIVTAVQSDLEVAITERQATVCADPLPVIRAIPQQMHQLFYNLISNALKFAEKGQAPRVSIGCHYPSPDEIARHTDLQQGHSYIQITIKDNGIGFKQEMAEKIFTLFQRLHSKDRYAGTGIGLAICRKVVQNHGGKIWAESSEGNGAAFIFILPLE